MLTALELLFMKFKEVNFEEKVVSQNGDMDLVEISCSCSANGKRYRERLVCVDLSEDFYVIFTLRTKGSDEEFSRYSQDLSDLVERFTHHTKKKWYTPNKKAKELTINNTEGNLFSSGKILQSLTGETIYINLLSAVKSNQRVFLF